MRGQLKEEHYATRARLHIPQLTELMDKCEMGGVAWRRHFICGFPTLGDLAELGVCSTCVGTQKAVACEELCSNVQLRVRCGRNKPDREAAKIRKKAPSQVA